MSPVTFTPEFERSAEIRAIEILVTALIATHPDRSALMTAIAALETAEEALFTQSAKSVEGPGRADALNVVNGQFAVVRDAMQRIISGGLRTG